MRSSPELNKEIIQNWQPHEIRALEACQYKKYFPTEPDGINIDEFQRYRPFQYYKNSKDYNALDRELVLTQRFLQVRDLMHEEEIPRLMDYLCDYFPEVNIAEIENAARMVSRKLLQVKEHYNDFGAPYMTEILDGYRNYRGFILRKYTDAEIKHLNALEEAAKPPVTPEQKRQETIQFVIVTYNNFMSGFPVGGLYRVYDFLEAEGKLDMVIGRWKDFEIAASEKIKREALKRGVNKDTRAISIYDALQKGEAFGKTTLLHNTKALAVQALYTLLMEKQMSIEDLILQRDVNN